LTDELFKNIENPVKKSAKVKEAVEAIYVASITDRSYQIAEKKLFSFYKSQAKDDKMIDKKDLNKIKYKPGNFDEIFKSVPEEAAGNLKELRSQAKEALQKIVNVNAKIRGGATMPSKGKDGSIIDPDNLLPDILDGTMTLKHLFEHTPPHIELRDKVKQIEKNRNKGVQVRI
jgi:hypothetical protein